MKTWAQRMTEPMNIGSDYFAKTMFDWVITIL